MTTKRKIKLSVSTFFLFILIISQHSAIAAANECKPYFQKFTIEQGVPKIHTYAENNLINTTVYVANLSKTSGKPAGIISGTITDYYPDFTDRGYQIRRRYLVFNLNEGQIIASGNGLYPANADQIPPNTSVIIPVIGGSEKYIGANGQVKTTHNSDGTYTHRFKLLK